MATRSLTVVYDENSTPLACMYGQYDGYLNGHGADLAALINSRRLVNGLSFNDNNTQVVNGMNCMAALIVARFKGDQAGGFYLYPMSAIDTGEEFEYHIYQNHIIVKSYKTNTLFEGNWDAFLKHCLASDE